MGPIIWYPEPRCASMGQRPVSVPVADVSKTVHNRQFPQQQIITQIQTFRDKVTMMNLQLTDLQHSLADLAILSARQEQFQQTCLEELRSLKTQPPTLPQPTWNPSSTTSFPFGATSFAPSAPTLLFGTSSTSASPLFGTASLSQTSSSTFSIPQPTHPPPPSTSPLAPTQLQWAAQPTPTKRPLPSTTHPLPPPHSSPNPQSTTCHRRRSLRHLNPTLESFPTPSAPFPSTLTTTTPSSISTPNLRVASLSPSFRSSSPCGDLLHRVAQYATVEPQTVSASPKSKDSEKGQTTDKFIGQGSIEQVIRVVADVRFEEGLAHHFLPIHRYAQALVAQATKQQFLVTGITVVDLLAPYQRDGQIRLFGEVGVGKTVLIMALGEQQADSKDAPVSGQLNEPPGAHARVGLTGLTVAEHFLAAEGQEVLLFLDNIFRFTQANSEVFALLGRLPSAVEYQPTLATDLGGLPERIAPTNLGSITSIQAIFVPNEDLTDPASATTLAHLDATIGLSRHISAFGVYPELSLHLPDWWFLTTSFMTRMVQRVIDTILVPHTTWLTDTFGWMRLCVVESFVRILGKTPMRPGIFFSRDRHERLHSATSSGPGAIFQGSSLCCHIRQLLFGDDHNLDYFQQLHFFLENTSVGQRVLSFEQIIAEKGELMALAHHEQQKGISLSSQELLESGIRKSFGFIPFTNLPLILAVFRSLPLFGYIPHTTNYVHISLFDILLGEICQNLMILTVLCFKLDSKDLGILFDISDTLGHTPSVTNQGSMICSTFWNNILPLMANGIFSTFIKCLTNAISTITLSRHMIDTTSVCLVVYNCKPCAIQFLLGSTIIVSLTIYFMEYLFPNNIGSHMLLGQKMQQAPQWSDGFFVIICEVFLIAACWVFPKAEQEMTIIWALVRHKNLGSCVVVCCHLQSFKTLVRTSLKATSYLNEIAQAGAKWGVTFDTMLAEADAAIPIAAIRRQFFGAFTIDLHADFSLLFTSNLDLWPGWDPGDALTTPIKLMLCATFQENHFNVHPPFLVLQLHPIHPAVYPTCLPPQLLATGVGILQPKSRLHPYQVLSVHMIEADICNLLAALVSSFGSKKMTLEHDKLVVFLLLGAHEFTLHSQMSLVEFSVGAQAHVVLEPRATTLEFSLVIGAAIRHFLTWHHGVSFSIFHQGHAISFLTQGLLILWTGIVVYLEIHTALILAASIMIISGTPRCERPSSARL